MATWEKGQRIRHKETKRTGVILDIAPDSRDPEHGWELLIQTDTVIGSDKQPRWWNERNVEPDA